MLRIALRNLFRNPRRTVLTILAIVMGILSSNGLAALARGLSSQLIDDAIFTLTGHIQIHHPEYLSDPVVQNSFVQSDELRDFAKNNPKVINWSSRVRVPAVLMSERDTSGVTLVGIDPAGEVGLSFVSEAVSQGRNIESVDDSGIVIGEAMARQLHTDLGRRIVLMGQDANGVIADRGFRIVGLYKAELEAKEKAYVFVGRRTAQKLFKMNSGISEISLRLDDRDDVNKTLVAIKVIAKELDVQSWMTLEPLVMALVKVQSGFLLIWFGIVIITISFGLVNTIFMSVFERVREFGLYQALGMTPAQVRYHVLVESLLLLVAGVLCGNIATMLLVAALSDGIDLSAFAQGTQMFGIKSIVFPTLILRDVLILNVATLVIGAIACLYPAWRASTLQPAYALAK